MMFGDFATALPLVQAGKLRALGVSTAQRVGPAPEIPPLAEVGLKGFDASSWQMMIAPGKIPPDILNRLNAEMRAIVAEPAVQKEFSGRGLIPLVERHAGGAAGLRQVRDRALGRRREARRRRRHAVTARRTIMPFASNRGVNIYYETYGDGPPMVLVHANPFDHRLFTYQIASFAPYFRLVALDIRGYGRSDKPETPFTLNDMADDVLAVCAQEKIARAIFMGVSVGSGMSLLIGLDRPEMCDAVILVGGSSKGGADIAGRVAGYTSADLRGYQRSHIRELVAPGFCDTQARAPGCSISSPRRRTSCPANASRRSSAPAKPATCASGSPA